MKESSKYVNLNLNSIFAANSWLLFMSFESACFDLLADKGI